MGGFGVGVGVGWGRGRTFTSLPAFLHSRSQGRRFSISATVLAMSLTLFESSPTWSLVNCKVWFVRITFISIAFDFH